MSQETRLLVFHGTEPRREVVGVSHPPLRHRKQNCRRVPGTT